VRATAPARPSPAVPSRRPVVPQTTTSDRGCRFAGDGDWPGQPTFLDQASNLCSSRCFQEGMRTAKRGMPGKRQLRFRREDAQAVVAATLGRQHEGLSQRGWSRLRSRPSQAPTALVHRELPQRGFPRMARPEHVDLLKPSFHVPTVLLHEIAGRVTPAAPLGIAVSKGTRKCRCRRSWR